MSTIAAAAACSSLLLEVKILLQPEPAVTEKPRLRTCSCMTELELPSWDLWPGNASRTSNASEGRAEADAQLMLLGPLMTTSMSES
jgi:hypothetical protein